MEQGKHAEGQREREKEKKVGDTSTRQEKKITIKEKKRVDKQRKVEERGKKKGQ